MLLTAGLALAGVLYLGFPAETVTADHDEGIYVNHAVSIARHGSVDVPYPWPAELARQFPSGFARLRGTWPTGDHLTVVFGHVFPLWLAQAYGTLGMPGMYTFNGLLALGSLVVFRLLAGQLVPAAYAVTATLFLAFNPSQLWISRLTLSEILTQLLVLSGVLLLIHGLRAGDARAARWAAGVLGLALAVRLDSLVLVPLILAGHAATVLLGWPARQTTPTWRAFYGVAVPVFALALAYYPVFSAPYWDQHDFLVRSVGTLIAGVLGALVVVLRWGTVLRPVATGRPTLAAAGVLVAGAALYGFFLRPRTAGVATFDLPGLYLDGTRSYEELSLPNLAQYISPAVVLGGVLGWAVLLWGTGRGRAHPALAVAVVLFGGYAALYLWKPTINPFHFWAVRRWVPAVIPGFVLFAFYALWWLRSRLPARPHALLLLALAAYLTIFTARADALIVSFAENRGYLAQYERLARRLPEDQPIVVIGDPAWWTPLSMVYGRRTIPLNVRPVDGKLAFWRLVEQRARTGNPLLVLADCALPARGVRVEKSEEVRLTRTVTERTFTPLPRFVHQETRRINVYWASPGAPGTSRSIGLVDSLPPCPWDGAAPYRMGARAPGAVLE
jgi:hypothetical protein